MKRWREVGDATVKVTRPRWPRPPPRRGAEPRAGGVWCPGSPAVLEGGLAGDRPGACRMRPPRRRTRTRTGRPRPAREAGRRSALAVRRGDAPVTPTTCGDMCELLAGWRGVRRRGQLCGRRGAHGALCPVAVDGRVRPAAMLTWL